MSVVPYLFPLKPNEKAPDTNGTWVGVATPYGKGQVWKKDANVALDCGLTNILVVDIDYYKPGVPPPEAFFGEDILNAVMKVRTPRGGMHLYFKQPEGKQLRNYTGTLPTGYDVRGYGGYVVFPHSRIDGKEYMPVDEIWLDDTITAPDFLVEALTPPERTPSTFQGRETEAEEVRTLLSFIPKQPGYEVWVRMLMAVHSAFPGELGIAICEEWSPGFEGEVRHKFNSFNDRKGNTVTIGTLYHEAMKYGYTFPVKVGVANDDTRRQLEKVDRFLSTSEAAQYIKERAAARVVTTPLLSLLMVMVGMGIDRGTTQVYVSCRMLADRLSTSGAAVWRQLERLQEMGVIEIANTGKGVGTTVDLNPLLNVTELLPEDTGNNNCYADQRFHQQHIGDDAFATYPYDHAAKRRGAPLLPSLGATGLRLWPLLVQGGTVASIAAASGYSKPTVKTALAKFVALSLVTKEMVGREAYYLLIPQAEAKLDELRPHMQTAWVGQLRVARNAQQTATFAWWKLRKEGRTMEPKLRAWWERLREDKDKQADVIFDFLDSMGYDGRLKVGKEKKVVKSKTRWDLGEEWRTWGRMWFDNYNALEGDHAEKVRLLTLSFTGGLTTNEEWVRVKSDVRSRMDMALMMSNKRVLYEAKPIEREEVYEPVREPAGGQIAFSW